MAWIGIAKQVKQVMEDFMAEEMGRDNPKRVWREILPGTLDSKRPGAGPGLRSHLNPKGFKRLTGKAGAGLSLFIDLQEFRSYSFPVGKNDSRLRRITCPCRSAPGEHYRKDENVGRFHSDRIHLKHFKSQAEVER